MASDNPPDMIDRRMMPPRYGGRPNIVAFRYRDMRFMKRLVALLIAGSLLVGLEIFYQRVGDILLLATQALESVPFSGRTVLQTLLIVDGLVLIWFLLTRPTFTTPDPAERLPLSYILIGSTADSKRISAWLLSGITVLALFLRLFHLNSDLWFDEIWPLLVYGQATPLQVIAGSSSLGNHVLNTILVNLSVAIFGQQEWAIRMPAVIFGTATIPVMYWVARMVLPWRASLGAALLLAVSYHHIFFSQDARGYTAYVLFSLLSSGLLVKGMQEDRLRIWILYIVTMVLNLASIMIAGYVFIAHIIVGAVALILVRRRGGSSLPLLRRLMVVFFVTALLALPLYANGLAQVYQGVRSAYATAGGGFALFSTEALQEVIRGISAGFAPGLVFAVLPFVLVGLTVGAVGFLMLLRRQWALTLALTLPEILTVLSLILGGLTFYPRIFLLALPLAILVGVQSIYALTKWFGKIIGKDGALVTTGLPATLILALCALSLLSLRGYYTAPKQPFRASLQYIEAERQPGDIIIAVFLAEGGYRFYGPQFNLEEGKDYFLVRSVEALDAVLAAHPGARTFVVTTFPRALRLAYPDLDARIARDWSRSQMFSATVGDGEVSVWTHQ